MKMIVFGTRPEIIKLYPVIKQMPDAYLVWTGQHDELATQMLEDFQIAPHVDLKVMTENQSLTQLTIKLHQKLSEVYKDIKPSLVIVQGDTTSAMVASVEAYYHKIPVAHIEAGLRTDDIYSPFPEEVNRRIITQIAKYNFTPTDQATINCTFQGHGDIYQVGQTGIDTLKEVTKTIRLRKQKRILVTIHRRENFEKIGDILEGIKLFLEVYPNWEVIIPVHPNPQVGQRIRSVTLPNQVKLSKPLSYFKMVQEMQMASIIVTDSGGIQEEAPSLKRPVLVVRTTTERTEGLDTKTALLVGTNTYVIAQTLIELVRNKAAYRTMVGKKNPYGDGKAGGRITKCLESL